ncbi:MAG: lysine exporter LysO family protein [bacterium]|nr:lysine exporter LysO family protein [bacterium]
MAWYYLNFFLGLFPGLLIRSPRTRRIAERMSLSAGALLILLFGMQLTTNELLMESMLGDTLAALLIATAAASGSILLTYALVVVVGARFKPQPVPAAEVTATQSGRFGIAAPMMLLVVGMILGYILELSPSLGVMRVALCVLIFAVGVQIGTELRTVRRRTGGVRPGSVVLLVGLPICVILGTLLFSSLIAGLLPFSRLECMLCAAPLGWQTLGGPLIMEQQGIRLGNLGFLANLFRDLVSLVLIPLVSRSKHKILGVAPGGVSTMDILLPVITTSSGREYLIHAIWVGACCSFWAPILIHLLSKAMP